MIWWDHPRLCGEKQSTANAFERPVGSPPPMRGKATTLEVDKSSHGITPAYAGKS